MAFYRKLKGNDPAQALDHENTDKSLLPPFPALPFWVLSSGDGSIVSGTAAYSLYGPERKFVHLVSISGESLQVRPYRETAGVSYPGRKPHQSAYLVNLGRHYELVQKAVKHLAAVEVSHLFV